MICDRCLREASRGEHGLGLCAYEPRACAAAVRPDTIVGGFVAENAWRTPRYFDSQKRYEKALDKSGLMLKPKRARGASPVTSDMIEQAKRLVERVTTRTKVYTIEERVLDESMTVTAELDESIAIKDSRVTLE